MSNGGFLINNLPSGCDSISASNTATEYNVITVKNGFVSDVFRSKNNSVKIDVEMVEAVPFPQLALFKHKPPLRVQL